MDKWVDVDKVAVVTGASFGISEETCKKLVKNGTIIAEFAIKEHRLQVAEIILRPSLDYVVHIVNSS